MSISDGDLKRLRAGDCRGEPIRFALRVFLAGESLAAADGEDGVRRLGDFLVPGLRGDLLILRVFFVGELAPQGLREGDFLAIRVFLAGEVAAGLCVAFFAPRVFLAGESATGDFLVRRVFLAGESTGASDFFDGDFLAALLVFLAGEFVILGGDLGPASLEGLSVKGNEADFS
mmetsp:Transcript_17757/g.38736  ORF Transcript_17757/g.38736 Transcript_17757/m.38736 type:complete len:174 (+) Transcript_17757:2195-2716(+)